MNSGTTFILILLGGLLIVMLGVGLVISAFVGGKPTKAGRVRAIVGGVIVAVCTAAYFIFVERPR